MKTFTIGFAEYLLNQAIAPPARASVGGSGRAATTGFRRVEGAVGADDQMFDRFERCPRRDTSRAAQSERARGAQPVNGFLGGPFVTDGEEETELVPTKPGKKISAPQQAAPGRCHVAQIRVARDMATPIVHSLRKRTRTRASRRYLGAAVRSCRQRVLWRRLV